MNVLRPGLRMKNHVNFWNINSIANIGYLDSPYKN